MTFNIGELTTINAAQVDTSADRFVLWDNSEAGAARTKAMTPQQARLLVQGVDTQRGSTKPTQRSDGTSLQSGDRWWDTSDLRWFFWNGTYWLTEEVLFLNVFADSTLSASFTPGGVPIDSAGNDIFILNFSGSIQPAAGTYDGTNNWTFALRRDNSANTPSAVSSTFTLNSGSGGSSSRVNFLINVNTHLDVSALDVAHLRIVWTRVESPGNLGPASCTRFSYRLAKP